MFVILSFPFAHIEHISINKRLWAFYKILFKQDYESPKRFILRSAWLLIIFGILFYYSAISAVTNTDRVSAIKYRKIEKFKHILEEKMIVAIETWNACNDILNSSNHQFREYARRNLYPSNPEHYRALEEIFTSHFDAHPREKLALMVPLSRWRQLKFIGCNNELEMMRKNPAYVARPFENRFLLMVINSNYDPENRKNLIKYTMSMSEHGLQNHRYLLAEKYVQSSGRDTHSCLSSEIEDRRSEHRPLTIKFVQPAFMALIILSFLTSLVFALEVFI